MLFDDTRRRAGCGHTSGQITMDKRRSADNAPCPNLATWHNRSADTNQRTFTDDDVAAEMCPRCNMNVIADTIVMVYSAAGVQDDVHADNAAGINNGARANRTANADINVGGNDSAWVLRCNKMFTLMPQTFKQALTNGIVANGYDHSFMRDIDQSHDITQDRQLQKVLPF